MRLFRCSHATQVEALETEFGKLKAALEKLEELAKDLDPEQITQHAVERIWIRRADELKRAALRRREEEKEREDSVFLPTL